MQEAAAEACNREQRSDGGGSVFQLLVLANLS